MRSLGVVTTSRADYATMLPLIRAIQRDPALSLMLYVSGAHLSAEFGLTVHAIEESGFAIEDRVDMLLSSDTPGGVAKSIGLGVLGFAQTFSRRLPDLLLVSGDRYEMLAAVLAALPFTLPVAHFGGGDLTEGAIDDSLRHSITKMSHLHFPSTADAARRVMQLGEDPARVFAVGEPSLDNIGNASLLSRAALEARFGVSADQPFVLVTYHPVTLEFKDTASQVDELLAALTAARLFVIFSMPNADTAGRQIAVRIAEWLNSNSGRLLVSCRPGEYHSMLSHATAVVGNSSSGLIEAPSFKVPTVNIGTRQAGRIRARNVIDVGNSRSEILAGIQRVTQADFRASLASLVNPYSSPTNTAVSDALSVLKEVPLGDPLVRKRFHNLSVASPGATYPS